MQRFHSERWNWWPHAVTIVLFSGVATFWFVRLAGGSRVGVFEWLYVVGMVLLALVSVLQLKSGATIDDRGISNYTLIGAALSPWDQVTEVSVRRPEQVYGKFVTSYFLRADNDVVLAWSAKRGARPRPMKLQVRIPQAELPMLLVTLAQVPTPVELDIPR